MKTWPMTNTTVKVGEWKVDMKASSMAYKSIEYHGVSGPYLLLNELHYEEC
jgi:hypothetical protein